MYVSVVSELSFSTLTIGLGHGRLDFFFFFISPSARRWTL